MNRREFLTYSSAAAIATSLSRVDRAFALDPMPAGWRTFEVITRVEVVKPSGNTRVWLPAALLGTAPFQKTRSNDFKAEGGTVKLVENKADALGIVVAEFPAGVRPAITLTSRIATRNYQVDLAKPSGAGKEKYPGTEYFLRPTKLMPTDGIVKQTAVVRKNSIRLPSDTRCWYLFVRLSRPRKPEKPILTAENSIQRTDTVPF
jgi:hypothetical protein